MEYTPQSANVTTPTSATFSATTGSPRQYPPGLRSPMSTNARPVSWGGARTPSRRLSVPSGGNAFSGPSPPMPQQPYMSPLPSSTSSNFSNQSSLYGSPTASNFSESRRESNADADWRRRTWHPGTYTGPRPATSGLGYYQTPDAPHPSYTSQPAASQTTRLPGIESFDHAPPPPSLKRRPTSPMQIDTPTSRPTSYHAPNEFPRPHHEKRTSISWDTTVQKINRLEIGSPHPPQERWSGYQGGQGQPTNERPLTAPHPSYMSQQQPTNVPQPIQVHPSEPKRTSQEGPTTPVRNKRQAWYNGPLSQPSQPGIVGLRTSPEDSSSSEGVPTPSNSTDYNPAIVHSNGYVEKQPLGPPMEDHKPAQSTSIMDRPHPIHHQYHQYHNHGNPAPTYQPRQEYGTAPAPYGQPPPHNEPSRMTALDALVAVATGEQQAVTNRS